MLCSVENMIRLLLNCLVFTCIFSFDQTACGEEATQQRFAQIVRESLLQEDRSGVHDWKKVYEDLKKGAPDEEVVSRWLALVYARNSMYPVMRYFLDDTIKSGTISRDLLCLRLWARLSDEEYVDGCQDAMAVVKSVKIVMAGGQFADLDVREAEKISYDVVHAAKAFGFCKAVAEVSDAIDGGDLEQMIDACREGLDGELLVLFDKQVKETFDNVSPAAQDVAATEEAEKLSFEDEKAQKDQQMQNEQAGMADAANQSLQTAEMVRMQAQQQLGQIEAAAAPFGQQRIALESQLASLRSQKLNDSALMEAYWDERIYEVQGALSGVYARLQQFQNTYQAVLADANRKLQELGGHVQLLAKNNWAHGLRRKKNEGARKSNKLRQIEREKKRVLQFATYAEIDFNREAVGILGSSLSQGVSID